MNNYNLVYYRLTYCLEKQKQKEEYERKVNKKIKDRKRKARLLTKKTKKGQPVMKNLLGNLMSKIDTQE